MIRIMPGFRREEPVQLPVALAAEGGRTTRTRVPAAGEPLAGWDSRRRIARTGILIMSEPPGALKLRFKGEIGRLGQPRPQQRKVTAREGGVKRRPGIAPDRRFRAWPLRCRLPGPGPGQPRPAPARLQGGQPPPQLIGQRVQVLLPARLRTQKRSDKGKDAVTGVTSLPVRRRHHLRYYASTTQLKGA